MIQSTDCEEMLQRGAIRDADVAQIRTDYLASTTLTTDYAEALLRLHAGCPLQSPDWSPFLVEAICEYLVHHAEPEGYLVAENARWLIEHVAPYGHIATSTELTLLIQVMTQARWTPPSLAAFGLAQIRHAVETAEGPLRAANPSEPGTITSTEVDFACRIIDALGGESSIVITAAEADALFAINRAIPHEFHNPAWTQLFVHGIGSAVLSSLGHAAPSRREIAARVRCAEMLATSIGGKETTAPQGAVSIWSTAPLQSPEENAMVRLERQRLEIVTNEAIEEATASWLIERLADQERLDPREIALIDHISREATRLPRALRELAARSVIAA